MSCKKPILPKTLFAAEFRNPEFQAIADTSWSKDSWVLQKIIMLKDSYSRKYLQNILVNLSCDVRII
jgi:hypothetical protein